MARFPDTVTFSRYTLPLKKLAMAPPLPLLAELLPWNVLLVTFRREAELSLLKMAPPPPPLLLLLLKVQPVTLIVPPVVLEMPPPLSVVVLLRIVLLVRLIVPAS